MTSELTRRLAYASHSGGAPRHQFRRRATSRPCSSFGTRYSVMARAMAVRSSGESSMNPTSFAGMVLVRYTAQL